MKTPITSISYNTTYKLFERIISHAANTILTIITLQMTQYPMQLTLHAQAKNKQHPHY